MYGDPHFITFDHSDPRTVELVNNPGLNHFWLVRSRSVEIQGLAWGKGSWAAGVAISGSFIGHHKLIAYNSWDLQDQQGKKNPFKGSVTWDGKRIQKRDGETNPMRGVKLTLQPGKHFFGDLKKVFENTRLHDAMRALIHRWSTSTSNRVHLFELPKQVKVWIIFTVADHNQRDTQSPGAEVLIQMPSFRDQAGYCGNFNGNPSDDKVGNVPPLRARDDMFRVAGLGKPQLLQTGRAMQNSTRDLCEADDSLYSKAMSVCEHLDDIAIWQACIFDACSSGDPELAAESTDDMLLLRAMSGSRGTSFPIDEDNDCCE